MEKNKFITKEVTGLPIGDSGYYFSGNKIENDLIESIYHICNSLYGITAFGMRETDKDEISASSKIFYCSYVLDLDDMKIHPGYAQKISEILYAIFDVNSIDVGWPAEDVIIIKNINTGKKKIVNFNVPADEGVVQEGKVFILSGALVDESEIPQKILKEWKIFIDENGKIIYTGYCSEYKVLKDRILIKKSKSNSNFIERLY